MVRIFSVLICLLFSTTAFTQQLKPGFDKAEYIEMLKITARQVDTPWTEKNVSLSKPEHYDFVYRSPIVGLDNLWDLWLHKQGKLAVLSIRGTTENPESWLENFYSAMVPAKGTLSMPGNRKFEYCMSDNPLAAVHVGWLLGMASLSDDVLHKVDSLYQSGYRDFIIMGHSQGGAIAFLMRSHMDYLQRMGDLPEDIRIKTYNSAAPKPGNLYYAYEYEKLNYGGWAHTVVNAYDWVPETPTTLQTVSDFNKVNPFENAGEALSQQPFPKNIVLKLVYNRLRKPGYKLLKRYKKYLGDEAYKMVKSNLPGFEHPELYNSINYMRAGTPVILMPDAEYSKKYPDTKDKIFIHHFPAPYLYLAERTL